MTPAVIDLGETYALKPALRKLWSMVLLLAIKDLATVIRYEPHRRERALSYRVNGVYYDLVPPGEPLAMGLIDEIEEMATPGGPSWLPSGLWRRLAGTADSSAERPQKSLVELKVGDQVVDAIITIESTRAGRSVIIYLVDSTVVSETESAAAGRACELLRRMYKSRGRNRGGRRHL